jgi:hypothetical protein
MARPNGSVTPDDFGLRIECYPADHWFQYFYAIVACRNHPEKWQDPNNAGKDRRLLYMIDRQLKSDEGLDHWHRSLENGTDHSMLFFDDDTGADTWNGTDTTSLTGAKGMDIVVNCSSQKKQAIILEVKCVNSADESYFTYLDALYTAEDTDVAYTGGKCERFCRKTAADRLYQPTMFASAWHVQEMLCNTYNYMVYQARTAISTPCFWGDEPPA